MRLAGEVDLEFQESDNNDIRRQLLDNGVVDMIIQSAEFPSGRIRLKVMFDMESD